MNYISKIVLLVGLSVWAGYLLGLFLSSKKRQIQRQRLNEEFAIARASLQQLKGQLDVLCQHSMEYFHTLFDAELPLLKEMAAAVEAAIDHAEILRSQGEFEQSMQCLRWILGASLSCSSKIHFTDKQIQVIGGWRPRSKQMLIECIRSLESAHEERKRLGIQRSKRQRRTTEVDLQRLKSGLILD